MRSKHSQDSLSIPSFTHFTFKPKLQTLPETSSIKSSEQPWVQINSLPDNVSGSRRYYISELGLIKRREEEQLQREVEMLPETFLDEVRQRNRLDRLRRAYREHILNDDCHDTPYISVIDEPTQF